MFDEFNVDFLISAAPRRLQTVDGQGLPDRFLFPDDVGLPPDEEELSLQLIEAYVDDGEAEETY